ncbi:MAG TPA: alpha/beta hydrolase-fold protein [Gemmatimonadales bacterium]|jgi:hypothetical protein|nr:alpha/beta hydrolase-fold protein [Gemmatimonadales bacterium]
MAFGPFGLRALDSLIAFGKLKEYLVVVPRATGQFGAASFYTNSAAAADWETFIARDLVRYVDRHYRTLGRAKSRGIAGGSGGGYGALQLAMRPLTTTKWRTALALGGPEQLPDKAHPAANVIARLAAAWSPDPDRPPILLRLAIRLTRRHACTSAACLRALEGEHNTGHGAQVCRQPEKS